MKNYTFWLKAASIMQFLTAIVHSISLFTNPIPENEKEKELLELMDTYKLDFGAGFHKTMNELMTPLSACLSLLCLLGGLINWYILQKKLSSEIVKGIIIINLIVFGICFGLIVIYAFLPPIIMTGLIFVFLGVSLITVPKNQ
jgi:hypothetical protein